MTKPEQQFQDIRSTGEEAELWLEALESDQLPSHKDTEPTEPVTEQYSTTQSVTTRDQAHPALVLLILAILFSPLILLAAHLSVGRRSPSTSPASTLGYSASCGSTISASGRWWPVLGGGEGSLLTTVKSRYCGDAFINATGALQAASFGSWEEADAFKTRIEQATGESFRVGHGIVPGE